MRFREILLSILVLPVLSAQPLSAQMAMNFVRYDSIPVFEGSTQLTMAWGGGMDMLQYSEIDLNLDGIKDLFVFDRSGNKITTYLNLGTLNSVDYVLAPQYVYDFPVMHDWALLRDYNCDGKEDIFTCSVVGFSIYENVSTVAGGLQFQLRQFVVNTDRSPNSTHFMGNLFVSMIDLPAIRDLDGDSDLDILTFSNGGPQVEYHKNMSMERYGVCDSIEYIVQSNCWGKFSENASSAAIVLNQGCLPVPIAPHTGETQRAQRHTGSCLECINTDGDSLPELLIGDAGSNYVVHVHNVQHADSALADAWNATYPATTPVNAALFTCPAHIDVNNDGKRDLLFSPSASSFSENKFSSWYYVNVNTNDAVNPIYIQNNFLQENMIDVGDGCYPVLYDYDLDGDKDLLIGNHGYYAATGPFQSKIALYRNNGTPSAPSFALINTDFAGIYAAGYGLSNLAPTFGDLDGDGDRDLLIGDAAGQLHFFRKDIGGPEDYTLATANYQGIDVGEFAAPQLIDVNRDGKIDLVIGEKTGRVHYYENTGTSVSPVFTLMDATFGGVNVCAPGWYTGHSVPLMFEDNGVYTMVVGSQRGWLYRYDNIEGNLGGNFVLTDSMYVSWREGGFVAPAVADMNGDGLYDMIIGNYAGGVSYFRGENNVSTHNETISTPESITVYPNPVSDVLTFTTSIQPDAHSRYQLIDVSGKAVAQGNVVHRQTTIACDNIAPGLYVLSVTTPEGIINRKVIIRRE